MTEPSVLNKRYQLLEPLGTGGMAQVYRARDLMLERLVAIKMLRPDYSANPELQVRFRQEAKAAANLSHPNIVTVHDFGFDQGRLFIVMEHVPGTNLKVMIDNLGKFSPEDTLPLIVQACAGVGYAHRAGLIHCDVKPHNILVTPDRRVKVTDFGIARAISGIHPDEQNDVVWGSPLYFSPEQASGLAPSPASDVYSLGVVMYEMLAGRPPFVAKTPETLARLHREVKPQPPSVFNPRVTPELEQIIMKVLDKVPSTRYRTADQLGRVLMTFGQNKTTPRPIASHPSTPATGFATVLSKPSQSQPLPAYIEPLQELETGEEPPAQIDWLTIGLGLLTLAAVGGLVPLWLAIFFRIRDVLP